MKNRRTCNELFLLAVANKYSISFEELERGVFDEFIHEDPDPNCNYLHSTEHFDRFVKVHEIKEVNVCAVVSYLKGVRFVLEHQENLNQVYELAYEIECRNQKDYFVGWFLALTAGALLGLAICVEK